MRGAEASEHQLQQAIVAWLDMVLPPHQRVVGVSNNPRSPVSGGLEKVRGMRKGFPDLIIVGPICGLLEVKTAKGRMRAEQLEWELWCERAGVHHAVVRSVEEVNDALELWGIKLRGHQLI